MKLPQEDETKPRGNGWNRSTVLSSIIFLACLCAISAGCSKDVSDTTARPSGQPASGVQSGSSTITPAQEAAKKRGMEQGPAVAAAMAAARGKKQ